MENTDKQPIRGFRDLDVYQNAYQAGHSKRHQKAGFQKYLDDAHTEANESIVSIEQRRDLYRVDAALCAKLMDDYNKIARQLFNLAEAWDSFKSRRRKTPPPDDTRRATV